MQFYDLPITTIEDTPTNLRTFEGQVLVIVNLASHCGFTSQYEKLEALYREYKNKGFSILGFPCNQFLNQEPGNNQEIKTFATHCYHITFPLFAKIEVKGKKQAPLYAYLQDHIKKKPLKFIPWNFTKILVDREGNVLKQYLPTTSFKTLRKEIEELL